MATQMEPNADTLRLNEIERVIGGYSTWKKPGVTTTAGLFFPNIGSWELAKEIDEHYVALIHRAYVRGVKDERDRPPY